MKEIFYRPPHLTHRRDSLFSFPNVVWKQKLKVSWDTHIELIA